MPHDDVVFRIRPPLDNDELNALHAEAFGHEVGERDWLTQLRHSLLWVGAFHDGRLIGFVNVAWDGGVHAFLLDTAVARGMRGRGIGTALVREAIAATRNSGSVEWLHVDSDKELMRRLYEPAGFERTSAAVVRLR